MLLLLTIDSATPGSPGAALSVRLTHFYGARRPIIFITTAPPPMPVLMARLPRDLAHASRYRVIAHEGLSCVILSGEGDYRRMRYGANTWNGALVYTSRQRQPAALLFAAQQKENRRIVAFVLFILPILILFLPSYGP